MQAEARIYIFKKYKTGIGLLRKSRFWRNFADVEQDTKYRLGVALSGGGARGIAHAGALAAIEEAGLHIDVIAGVSAGSVIAVLYAAGVTPATMLNVFREMSFSNMVEFKLGGGGLFKMEPFKNAIMKVIAPAKNIEDLKIPVYIGATDLDGGESVYFTEGPIGERMMASCSIPVVFKPVRIGGVDYVDGGVLRNLPSRVLRPVTEKLIGMNVSPMSPYQRGKNSMLEVALRTYSLMARHNVGEDQSICDLAVETRDISAYGVFNLKDIEKVYTSGYMNMRAALRHAGWWNPGGDEAPRVYPEPDDTLS